MRWLITDFMFYNPYYRYAEVSFYTVSDGVKTDTLATLYVSQVGNEKLKNPQRLDKDGQFVQPVYVDTAVVAVPEQVAGAIASSVGRTFPVEEPSSPQSYVSDYNPQLSYTEGDTVTLVDGDGAHEYWYSGTGSGFPDDWNSTFYISGTVSGAADTTLTLSGDASASLVTSDTFRFTDLENGSYQITPSKVDTDFEPTYRDVTVADHSVSGADFASYSISGTVTGTTGAGVIELTTLRSTLVAGNGTYTLSGFNNGTYTVVPEKVGEEFTPAATVVVINGANQTGVDFAVVPSIVYATWNTSSLNMEITNGGLTVSALKDNPPSWEMALGSVQQSTGKWYWEITIDTLQWTDYTELQLGVANSDDVDVNDSLGSDVYGWSREHTDDFGTPPVEQKKLHSGTYTQYGSSDVSGAVIGFALDLDGGTLETYFNGVSEGVMYSGVAGASITPAVCANHIHETANDPLWTITANFGQTAFTYSPPDGYNSGFYTE